MDFENILKECADSVNGRLADIYSADIAPTLIKEAQKYSLLSGGKRVRAYLVFAFCKMFGGNMEVAADLACAVEMVHAYSLIHDDLPCMDNDDYRRGKLTNHKVYGEAVAVLAGDALLTKAFEVIASCDKLPKETAVKAVLALSQAAGDCGMVGGQILDMNSETSGTGSLEALEKIHRLKTGAMIKVSAKLGCLAAGIEENSKAMNDALLYAENIGYAFQIVDDILDVVGDSAVLGKQTGSDKENGKLTFMSFMGLEAAKELAAKLTDEAVTVISEYENSQELAELARYLLWRKK